MFALPTESMAVPINLYSGDTDGVVTAGLDINGDEIDDYNLFADGTPNARRTWVEGIGSNVIATDILDLALSFGTSTEALAPAEKYGNTAFFLREEVKEGEPKTKGKWQNDIHATSYMGLKFQIGSNMHYGWAAVSTELGSASLNVTSVGFDSTPIPNPVPEPSSMALMLLGAAGVSALKMRRRNNTTN